MIQPADTRVFEDYCDFFAHVISNGRERFTRGGLTREVTDHTFQFPAGLIPHRAGMSMRLGFLEFLEIIAGTFSLERIQKVAPKADIKLFETAANYGPRLQQQWMPIIDELQRERNSRRAVLHLPTAIDTPQSLPCTTAIQFLLRDNTLWTTVTMRSWDLWYGLPTDCMVFGGLALLMAGILDVTPGFVTINAGSAHIYEPHFALHPTANQKFSYELDYEEIFKRAGVIGKWGSAMRWASEQAAEAPWDHYARPVGIVKRYWQAAEVPS